MTYFCPICGADTQGQSACPNWVNHPGVNTGAGTMTTMKLTLKEKVQSLVGAVACNGSVAAWAVEEILELFLKEKTIVANECIAALDDINNYDRILALLGMQEEGDPVAWVEAHLAKGAQVPDERVYAPLPSDADEYDRGHVDGWNACRQAMLSQRGEET